MKTQLLDKEHDEIMDWIYNNPDFILTSLNLPIDNVKLSKLRQEPIYRNKTEVGHADVRFDYKSETTHFVLNFIIDKDIKSVSGILRKIKTFRDALKKTDVPIPLRIPERFIIVSKNEKHADIFKQENIAFISFS